MIAIGVLVVCLASPSLVGAKDTDRKVKEAIDSAAANLKVGVDKISENTVGIQRYLENHPWKGVLRDEASAGPATLKDLTLNGHKKVVFVKPGETIAASVYCSLDQKQCAPLDLYRVVIGFKNLGAQTTIVNCLGGVAGKSEEKFSLKAPNVPGIYQVRFRTVAKFLESDALNAWTDVHGKQPDGTTTLGIVVVTQ